VGRGTGGGNPAEKRAGSVKKVGIERNGKWEK